jgi:hypothetical protein
MTLSPHLPIPSIYSGPEPVEGPSSPHLFVLMEWANFFMDATQYYDIQHYYFGNV